MTILVGPARPFLDMLSGPINYRGIIVNVFSLLVSFTCSLHSIDALVQRSQLLRFFCTSTRFIGNYCHCLQVPLLWIFYGLTFFGSPLSLNGILLLPSLLWFYIVVR